LAAEQPRVVKLLAVVPILRMFDVAKAREFYLEYLGFSVDFEHRFHETAPLFMGISRDGVRFFLSEHHGDGSPGAHITVNVEGIEALHAELVAKRYHSYNPGLQDQEWGTREMTVIDPFGNHVTFREPIAPQV
jgi:uncharacterized glyoxalase superfamily protein PhnB